MVIAILSGVANPESNSNSSLSAASVRPVQDEWGFYDPEQAGFEAVLRKLSLMPEFSSFRQTEGAGMNRAVGTCDVWGFR